MKRRLFLKALSLSPLVPSVLLAKEKAEEGLTMAKLMKARDALKVLENDADARYPVADTLPEVKTLNKWFCLKPTLECKSSKDREEIESWIQRCEDGIFKRYPEPPDISWEYMEGKKLSRFSTIHKV